jgi:hypothetical protein
MGRFLALIFFLMMAAPVAAQTINITGTVTDYAGASAIFTEPVSAVTPITMGVTAIDPTDDSGDANSIIASATILSAPANLSSLSLYVTAAGGQVVLGVYDNSGPNGQPGKLLAQTASFTPVVGWNTAEVIAPVDLSPHGTYWLAFATNSNGLGTRYQNGGSGAWYSAPFGALPQTFSTSPTLQGLTYSFYATLTPAAVQDFTVTTTVNPAGAGTTTGDGTYPAGTSVTVTATPN